VRLLQLRKLLLLKNRLRRRNKLKRHNFFLPDETVEELKQAAHEDRTTMSDLIRKAILEYLDGRRTDSDSATGA